ncbi:nucleotidyltransferase [Mucilaginibacter sp. NFX135]|uniref:nucleotidyltransferase n=1 Tax=Mucilaginibacter sp. NFX135 TaxID=3402687 RepID=UPI003AFAFF44
MDVFDEDILSFWKSLQNHQVQYILIGGYAINMHGYQRFTGDLDIWLKDDLSNRQQLRKVFIECNIGDYPMIEDMQFLAGWTDFHLNNNLRLDILTEMKGLENYSFDECLQMASIAEIDGIMIPFLHINQLIENKRVINRPKDQIDVMALEEIKKLRENES